MDILRDSITISLILLLLSLSSCKRYSFIEMESFFNLKLNDKVEFLIIDEYWNNFNGDGEKVVVFELKKFYLKSIYKNAITKGFKVANITFDKENFTERELKYVNGDVLYKTIISGNEKRSLVIDTLKRRVIFYYSLQ